MIFRALIPSELKSISVIQSIVRAIAPILFGLEVTLDHSFGSKWLIDEFVGLDSIVSIS